MITMTKAEITQLRVRSNFDNTYASKGGWEELKRLVAAGASTAAIGAHFGISRQRAFQIIKTGGLK